MPATCSGTPMGPHGYLRRQSTRPQPSGGTMLRIRAIVPALCALAIAACGGGGSGGGYSTGPTGGTTPTSPGNSNPVTTNTVTLTTDSFSPSNISVAKGTTVTWNW